MFVEATFVVRLLLCHLLGSVSAAPALEPGIDAYENYLNEVHIDDENAEEKTRNAVQSPLQLWPNKTIYYRIADDFNADQASNVQAAVKFFNEATCLKFREYDRARDGEVAHIYYKSSTNLCGTNVGYKKRQGNGPHDVVLTERCLAVKGVIQHETLHVLGLYHEQSRPDRDEYVEIDFTNIEPKYWMQFMKYPESYANGLGVPYDYGSLMHYPAYAFAKNPKKPSMRAKNNHQLIERIMGQTNGPSESDLTKIRILYECN